MSNFAFSIPFPMMPTKDSSPYLPPAQTSIQAGKSLGTLLSTPAVDALAHNLSLVYPKLDAKAFRRDALDGLEALALLDRGRHLARVLRTHLPARYRDAVAILIRSLTPPLDHTSDYGMEVFFYLPHTTFVGTYGVDPAHNGGREAFEVSMRALHELTRRFTSEFAIRPFLLAEEKRTLGRLKEWTRDPDPHVRRLCSEGSRPRLPWGIRLQPFIARPTATLPILEALKDDPELYVRRSVANHLGDIAKDHPDLVFDLCARWVKGASAERKWLIRHAVRYHAKRSHPTALRLRALAKA